MDIEKYRNVSFETREVCLVCEKQVTTPIIDFPDFPLTEIYVDKKPNEKLGFADQSFQFCENCGHGQLEKMVDPELQYGHNSEYFFRTSQSVSGRETSEFFVDFFNRVVDDIKVKTIVELGCNDLYLLSLLKFRAEKLIGIDPILKNVENEFHGENITAVGDFFEKTDLDDAVDIFICKDVLEHVSKPKEFLIKVIEKSHNNTLFLFQFPILDTILEECRFDQVFHQHVNYFTLKSFIFLLNDLGYGLLDFSVNYDHWGAAIFAFKKGNINDNYKNIMDPITSQTIIDRYESFKVDLLQTNRRLEYFSNETIYGYGAALMLPILSYHIENNLSCLKNVVDDDRNKEGLYYINLPVKIAHGSMINDIADSVVLLTAIFSKISARMILKNLFKLKPKHIIYPLKTM